MRKYDFIDEVIEEVLVNKSEKEERTDRIDRFLTGKWLGLPIFLAIMALVFFLTFTVGDWLKGYFETGLDLLTGFVGNAFEAAGVSPMIESLIVDGIISGVGGILTHLRRGRDTDLPAEHFHSVPRARFPGGQRVHGESCVCYG